jgi:hypothetical protein
VGAVALLVEEIEDVAGGEIEERAISTSLGHSAAFAK